MSSFDNALLVLLAFALVVLNGFFVAAEFSLVKLRSTRAQELSSQRGWRGSGSSLARRRNEVSLMSCGRMRTVHLPGTGSSAIASELNWLELVADAAKDVEAAHQQKDDQGRLGPVPEALKALEDVNTMSHLISP